VHVAAGRGEIDPGGDEDGANFWPLFWGLIGGGAGLTALLALLAATLRLPGRDRPQPWPVIEETPRHREESGTHLLVAGRK
jgi:hypothetical protein